MQLMCTSHLPSSQSFSINIYNTERENEADKLFIMQLQFIHFDSHLSGVKKEIFY